MEKDPLPSSLECLAVGKSLVLAFCWSEASLSSLPCGSPHRAAHIMAACFSYSEQAREQEREMARRTEATGIFNLILEVTSHRIHCILFIRSESLGPVYTRRHERREVAGHRQPFQEAFLTTTQAIVALNF